ncbi:Gene Transfer Agent tail protein [Tritonibacter mobilis]|uniref:phage major tail protein, TP901-1 family n=1 Tax=Tritonibacter mobilis TaxID=379347 RepID=UPI0001B8B38E|nr:phage major tail protein, TP901-1 family [Tritonibacter mobilis]EEW56869.1 phage major tail protein, -1 family [Ruegeria sp. TrichCH4B]NHM20841.1 phage major tail protein, TP901-1 family [Tritonibacter mobilis]NHM24995.1 phage major tail protein, TP901-1 family [Tritonibacter mobilis]VCU58857.1 Gene Transfer Agent tail protein [Tritonibacter mobilis]
MSAQNGKDLLIKVDMTGTGSFTTIAGLRATRISFNAESVDVTSLDSAGGWRELLGGAGVRSANLSGSGVFRDADTDERARQLFFDGETPAFQVVIPDFGTVEGPFQVTALEYAGSHNGEATYELSLASAGALTFTAV